jgi:hypothetical protein
MLEYSGFILVDRNTLGPSGFIHFFVEQNQRLFKDFPGQKLVFKHLFLSIFIYKTLLNLTFLQVKMPVPSQENDGCPMSVVLWVKVHMAEIKI